MVFENEPMSSNHPEVGDKQPTSTTDSTRLGKIALDVALYATTFLHRPEVPDYIPGEVQIDQNGTTVRDSEKPGLASTDTVSRSTVELSDQDSIFLPNKEPKS